MARIIEIENGGMVNNVYRIHSETRARYSEFRIRGERFVRIETFGREDRIVNGVASQNIQFTEEIAIELVRLLRGTFNIP
jgi:hypothetical protein